ncbi:MAG: pyridoxamine 5'-phosphate oxidase [Candidatus Kapabacteria bacterium]|nr:pyridoxamine 5'-phosphate oxidase [Candidatus Kapabacteria bacterium]
MSQHDVDIAALRKEYIRGGLDESAVNADPIVQFSSWLNEAITAEVLEPTAMVLSTVSADGAPSSRVVLLKGIDDGSLRFYTNYDSRKGRELTLNPRAALLFFWPELERQVRIEGTVSRLSPETSTAYFHSRPFESQLGAASSPQSQVIPSREELDQRFAALAAANAGRTRIDRPAHWGGFALMPHTIEFWQGRASRMHDRIRFRKSEGAWVVERLAP